MTDWDNAAVLKDGRTQTNGERGVEDKTGGTFTPRGEAVVPAGRRIRSTPREGTRGKTMQGKKEQEYDKKGGPRSFERGRPHFHGGIA